MSRLYKGGPTETVKRCPTCSVDKGVKHEEWCEDDLKIRAVLALEEIAFRLSSLDETGIRNYPEE